MNIDVLVTGFEQLVSGSTISRLQTRVEEEVGARRLRERDMNPRSESIPRRMRRIRLREIR